jgi:hypothetical protein
MMIYHRRNDSVLESNMRSTRNIDGAQRAENHAEQGKEGCRASHSKRGPPPDPSLITAKAPLALANHELRRSTPLGDYI